MDVSVSVTRRDCWIRRLQFWIALLDLIDCKTNAEDTLFANKELDEYKVNYFVAMSGHWEITVIFQTVQKPATMSIAHAVKDRRAK